MLNLRDASWETMPGGGTWVSFQAEGVAQQIGVGVHVLPPGEAPGRYHAEATRRASWCSPASASSWSRARSGG